MLPKFYFSKLSTLANLVKLILQHNIKVGNFVRQLDILRRIHVGLYFIVGTRTYRSLLQWSELNDTGQGCSCTYTVEG